MKKLLWLLFLVPMLAHATPCPVTTGALTLNVTQPRTSAISPFLAFFDATGTTTTATLGGGASVPQDVYFGWNFGDPNASGTGKWAYGSNPNGNSKNVQNGGIAAAHLYVLPTNATTDQTYTAQVWAKVIDASTHVVTVATCTVTVTVRAPSGTNGYPNANTTCVATSTTPVAGSGGCPAGAAVLQQANFVTALGSLAAGKRILFKCGDTFTGTNFQTTASSWSIGAYGGCEGTQTSRPIFSSTTAANDAVEVNPPSVDTRISDIDFEGTGHTAVNSVWGVNSQLISELTLWNLVSGTGYANQFTFAQDRETGVIGSVGNTTNGGIGTYFSYNEYNITLTPTAAFYQAVIGNSLSGAGCCSGSGIETLRISAGHMGVVSNNTLTNASSGAAVLKLHEGNAYNNCGNFCTTWNGVYTEYIEVSDNFFGGNSGGELVEHAPQNGGSNEHLRYIINERNIYNGTGTIEFESLLISGANMTVRNNVFVLTLASQNFAIQAASRGIEPTPTGHEYYNNTCYSTTSAINACMFFGTNGIATGVALQNSFVSNTLFYDTAGNKPVVTNSGTGNTITNNSINSSLNPNFLNGSGNFSLLGDFLPQANATGATSAIPNYFDAFNLSWTSVYQLGALSQGAP